MPSSNAERPAAAVTANGPLKSDPLPREISPRDSRLVAQYQEARRRFARRIDDLDTLGAWKRDLEERLARTALIYELVDHEADFDSLVAEVADFKAICFALAGRDGTA